MAGSPLKTFSCPNCCGTVELRNSGRSLSVVCPSCLSVLDPTSPTYDILSKFNERSKRIAPLIALGSRGTLKGAQYECLGFMVRADKSGIYSWDEYLLYNPMIGYRWLVIQNGHCNFVTPLKSPPVKKKSELGSRSFQYSNMSYSLFTNEPAIVQFVLGEFYWAVSIGETVQAVDYIHPPYMLSFEITKSEIMASVGEYIPAEEVTRGFQLKGSLGMQDGPAPNQVNPYQADSGTVVLLAIPFAIGLLVLGSAYSYENMFTFEILLFGYVFWYFHRMNAIETARWQASDFTPNQYLQSGDTDGDD